jgi:Protein of unknown function (DUF4199)
MKIGINVKLAVIAGILVSVGWYTFAKKFGFYDIKVYLYKQLLTLALLAIGVFLSVYLTKRSNQGFLEFKQCLKTGVLYSLVLALVLAIFNYLYFTFITPDTIDFFLSEAKNAAIAHNLKDAELAKFLDAERSSFSSFRLVPPVIFFGLIASLLAGAIFQKKDPNSLSFSEN